MALTVKNGMSLVRLIDSVNDNPLELTIGNAGRGRVALHLEDRDEGTMTKELIVDIAEIRAALALIEAPHGIYGED